MKKMPRPEVFKMFSRAVGSGTSFRVESGALVVNADFYSVRRAFQNDVDDFAFILAVSMNDSVGHCLANSHVNSERSVVTDT